MLKNLNHLTLAVSKLDHSIVFYQQLLGLKLHVRWDNGAYLTCGELWCCLSVDASRHFVSPQESDYTHYAFSIAQEDVTAFIARLDQEGVTCWKENKSEGLSYYFLDPDGHKLEAHVGNLAQRLAACREKPYQGMVFFD
ncbi:catechol 2,3-dioxygenase-like lactoylglutathione lyase family enzyme [Enterobacter sp. BIGb0383]|uniref:FosA family fosfomycin resistance glutathione transferase n=1 Tax=unclassified Enterobacter TaxID=2608935 RepID=UPI000F47E002|nr:MULTISPECIES: FosA family fosfomycin resistance glutathione transferase [unclassified Enterobacter]ROP59939.1 catechol 2,3-dioxygenase-like lactoylglutathione lyase family enzyme [Enterobacter sp. BIGb0383]ROS08592.1 catechol 2,3-dioxygenase-like lactoylglutathione lyase family enzyme [Enterobacter sp. BIGb0359]